MNPTTIAGATRNLGAPPNWNAPVDGECGTLPILDSRLEGGTPAMTSAWQPTIEEIDAIVAGNPVYLRVIGHVHPPVSLWVES